ncbi:MAG: ATP-binding protein [Bacteroidetes bacterium]|nr:ATP-binding protein [Bacteroidota bacterium]
MLKHFPEHSRRTILYFATCLLVFVLSSFVLKQGEGTKDLRKSAIKLQNELHDAEQEIEGVFDLIEAMDEIYVSSFFERNRETWKVDGLSFYAYRDGHLHYWSDNSIPGFATMGDWETSGPCLLLGNGWYLLHTRSFGEVKVYGFLLLKNEYSYENRFLTNSFNPRFELGEGLNISFTPDQSLEPVSSRVGEELFYLTGSDEQVPFLPLVIAFLVSLIGTILLGSHLLYEWLDRKRSSYLLKIMVSLLILSLSLVGLKYWSSVLLDKYLIFDPSVFASTSYFSSLVHLMVYGFITVTVFYHLWNRGLKIAYWRTFEVILLILVYFSLTRVFDAMIRILIRDGSLDLDVSDLLNWNVSSLLGLLTIGLFCFSALYLARLLAHQLGQWNTKRLVGFFSISLVLLVLIGQSIGMTDMVKVLWSWILLMTVFFTRTSVRGLPRIFSLFLSLSVLAIYASLVLEKELVRKENRFLGLVAERLMENKDPLAEELFAREKDRILSDSLLWESFEAPERVKEILKKEHLRDYWSKYEMDVRFPTEEDIIRNKMDDGQRLVLYPSTGDEPGLNYVLKLSPDSNFSKALFIGFRLNLFPEELGFPELLQEGGEVIGEALNRYSMAYYKEGRLIDQFGEHRYPIYLEGSFLEAEQPEGRVFVKEGQRHMEFTRSDYTYLISRDADSWTEVFTTFTYVLFFLGVVMGIGTLLAFYFWGYEMGPWGLQNKVQVLVVSMVLGSLFIFGLGSYAYIISQDEAKNERILSEKVDSVLIELGQKIERENALNDLPLLEDYLVKFSKVFFSDINLYNLDGQLIASSRDELFSRGLGSELIDPKAFDAMRDGETLFVHEESIGGLDYLSAYVPFIRSDKQTVAYLNLPYFAKQGELENELSEFLVAVVNVLMLLFILSILVGVVVSSWLTRPLTLLRDNLAQIKLGSANRPISYDGSDEISSLVAAYNAKVKELQENAELLAKSERESAWREMAKQVAHEIKNPLTPMKLSIQYLQKSLMDKGPDWEDRFKRSTNMLIEQIDTLSDIATAFSDFAKMPSQDKEKMDLVNLLEHTVELFENEPNASISFRTELRSPQFILADRNQMKRLFTNLIKNAVQSIPEGQEGRIEVRLVFKGHQYILEVKDNGVGIPEAMREKIFEPNFTTKGTGTGLGLAMCKNIVQLSGGEIWFRTEEGKGTSFLVSLPNYS